MVGRLDKDTTGLLLLTDDGRLVNALLRSQHAHYKTYLVRVERALKVAALRSLRRGVTITTYSQRDGNSKALTAPTLPAQVQQVRTPLLLPQISACTHLRALPLTRCCESLAKLSLSPCVQSGTVADACFSLAGFWPNMSCAQVCCMVRSLDLACQHWSCKDMWAICCIHTGNVYMFHYSVGPEPGHVLWCSSVCCSTWCSMQEAWKNVSSCRWTCKRL